MDKIERLRKGDRVALVATARKVSRDEMAPALKLLRSWGLEAVEPENLYCAENQMAGSDENRADMLQRVLDDDDIRAVFCVRGGYGTVRIIDRIDLSHFAQHPKWIVGYSDVTVLHSHIHQNFGIPTLHAIMPINIPDDADSRHYPAVDSLRQMLFEGSFRYENPVSAPCPTFRPGKAEGVVVGGNLSILYSLIGTPSDTDTDGKILMIEDLDEYLYHIDRMMTALGRSGKLARLGGLIVGAMTDMHDNAVPFGRTAVEIVWDCVKDYDYPVIFNAKFGHIGTENLALPFGCKTAMEVDSTGVLTLSAR